MRQSPRGESVTLPTLGPSGRQEPVSYTHLRKLCVDEGILVYSVHFADGYVYKNLYEYGCLV